MVFSCFFVAPRAATAQPTLEILKAGKDATALIEIEEGEGGTATAFCVDTAGLFMTNWHVAEAGSRLKVIVNWGGPARPSTPPRLSGSRRSQTLRLSRPRE